MNQMNEEVQSQLQILVDEVLYWAMDDVNKTIVEQAAKVFMKGSDSETELNGFGDWLVHDYRTDSGQSIIQLFLQENEKDAETIEKLSILENSIFSAFEEVGIKGKTVVKDLFTKVDYELNTPYEINGILLCRLYKMDGKYICLDQPEYLGDDFKRTLIKGMLEKYNEYCRLFSPMDMVFFMKKHSQVLYRLMNIIEATAAAQDMHDEEYMVHQSTYIAKDMKPLLAIMKKDDRFESGFMDEAGAVIKLLDSTGVDVIAEIVLADGRMEIECTSSQALEYARSVLEDIFESELVHVRDEILSIDDLLN